MTLYPRVALAEDETDFVLVAGGAEVAERATNTLQTLEGQWVFDAQIGLRGLDRLFEVPADPDLWRAEVYRVLSRLPGITRVLTVNVTVDRPARNATITWTALADSGTVSGAVTID
jgi:hypothetical protein